MVKLHEIVMTSLFCLVVGLASQNKTNAQTSSSCNDNTKYGGYIIRSVKIEGKWVPHELQKKIELIVGQRYDPNNSDISSNARKEIKDELTRQQGIDLSQGVVSVIYIDQDICDVSDKNHQQVEITFHPYYLRVDLLNIGNNILPVPRANTPTFSAGVPPALLATAPTVGISTDRNYGPSLSLKTTTNLLNPTPNTTTDSNNGVESLKFNLEGRHSLSQSFYNVNTGLDYTRPDYGGAISPNLSVRYSNQLNPLGEGEDWREQVQIEGGIQQKLNQSFIKIYAVGGSVRFLNSSYTPRNSNLEQNSETGLKLYALGDSRIGDGFARFGAWFDGGFPSKSNSYQRVAIQGGYSTELGPGHNTVGLEVMGGSGYAWGNPPEYSRFFGGSLASNFLYDSLNSPQVRAFPVGPILRSFGEKQAGLRGANGLVSGGNFYWNLNLNITFPIADWSQPLIPDIIVDKKGHTLSNLLVGSYKLQKETTIIPQLMNHGYSENMARKILDDEVTPTIDYLANRANLYSIKPMLLFDVAQISGDNGFGSNIWAGVGGGIQANIVNGRLETGYMQTITPVSDSSSGNFFLRFFFQNFF